MVQNILKRNIKWESRNCKPAVEKGQGRGNRFIEVNPGMNPKAVLPMSVQDPREVARVAVRPSMGCWVLYFWPHLANQ